MTAPPEASKPGPAASPPSTTSLSPGPGDTLLAALNGANQVAIVYPNGTHHTVLTTADGLSNPTSVAVRGSRVYVPSAAFSTQKDPNLLLARLKR